MSQCEYSYVAVFALFNTLRIGGCCAIVIVVERITNPCVIYSICTPTHSLGLYTTP